MVANADSTAWQASTIANIRAAHQTNGRLGSRKTRNGCITCKIRRVKCDEVRPACKRCLNTGRKCDGYTSTSSRYDAAASGTVGTISRINVHPFRLNEAERTTFDYYLSYSGAKLAGAMDVSFWRDDLLPICHSEPFVLDAILALSTLYRYPQFLSRFSIETVDGASPDDGRIERKTGDPFGNLNLDDHHASALTYYNRSIIRLTQRLENETKSITVALLSCLLFLAIEFSRDHLFAALELYKKGSLLLRNARQSQSNDPLVDSIGSLFDRLEVLNLSFSARRSQLQSFSKFTPMDSSAFASITDARSALFSLIVESKRFICEAADYTALVFGKTDEPSDQRSFMKTMQRSTQDRVDVPVWSPEDFLQAESDRETPQNLSPKSARFEPIDFGWNSKLHGSSMVEDDPSAVQSRLAKQEYVLLNKLGQWHDAFTDLWSVTQQSQPEVASLLLMYYHVHLVWLSTRLCPEQTAFDKYNHHFRQILRHAQTYVQAKAIANTQFTFDVGVIPPLCFVVTKCRVPSLRRNALKLLTKAPRKECVYGAITCAEAVACFVAVEEERLALSPPHDLTNAALAVDMDERMPVEVDRVHHFQILKDDESFSYSVLLSRYIPIPGGKRMRQEIRMPIEPLILESDD